MTLTGRRSDSGSGARLGAFESASLAKLPGGLLRQKRANAAPDAPRFLA